ncbi:MAG: hypothetical protein IKB51_04840 [Clostridia bacterium]|nr:hypothetical protein [Clostridia bacterium]
MHFNKKNRICALIIGIAVTLTALLSLAFSVFPFFFFESAPKLMIDVLTVINFILPITGIAVMIVFIYRREKL